MYKEIKRGTKPIDVEYTLVKDVTVLKYILGELPGHNIIWMIVDYIYLSYNIGCCH